MSAFNASEYYAQAASGSPVDTGPLLGYVKTFPQVVLWGASLLGQAVQKCLKAQGIAVSHFWDLRHTELKVDGLVTAPYAYGSPGDTLVILCVGNTIIQPEMVRDIQAHGYSVLLGDYVFQGLGCLLTCQTGVDANACLRGCCRAIYCARLSNIVKAQYPQKAEPALFPHSMTIVVNQICTLSCMYCTSYMNEYPPQDRINFSTQGLIDDIKTFFKAVDGVGTITIMGGEPFMHPDLSAITQAVLDCGNFGVISIATSGTCKIKPKHLASVRDRRVNVSFSNYLSSLTEKQIDLFNRNVAFLEKEGIPYTTGAPGPYWIIPSTLAPKHLTVEALMEKHRECVAPLRTMQIKNGAIYPCDFANSVHGLKAGHHPDSFISIPGNPIQLRQQMIDFENQDYFSVCDRCEGCQGSTGQAGEQGYIDLTGNPPALPQQQ